MNVEGGKLVVEPVLELVELLSEQPDVEVTIAELEEDRRKLSEEGER
jgi:hypothetical protein